MVAGESAGRISARLWRSAALRLVRSTRSGFYFYAIADAPAAVLNA